MRVGLTGGIGAGKSTVAGLLASYGALVADADALAREVVAPGSVGLAAVVAEFGGDVLGADGGLDRAAMAQRVFADPEARRRLEAIVHPLVRARIAAVVAAAPADAVVVEDIPLLVETGQAERFDVVVVVEAPESVRLERLSRRGVDVASARARMAAQASSAERLAVADYVIDNGGDETVLSERVARVWAEITGRSPTARPAPRETVRPPT